MGFPKTAFILSAGFGSRMKDLCQDLPKPLLKVNNKTLLHWQVINLNNAKIKNIGINIHFKAELMLSEIEFLKKEFSDINFFVSIEKEKILGQLGGIVQLASKCNEDFFLTTNTDSFIKLNPINVSDETIHLYVVKNDLSLENFSKVAFDNTGFFITKKDINPSYYYTGYMLMHRNFIKDLKPGTIYHINEHLWQPNKKRIQPIIQDGIWLDLGEKEKYEQNKSKLEVLVGN